jgi:hypothetical protein
LGGNHYGKVDSSLPNSFADRCFAADCRERLVPRAQPLSQVRQPGSGFSLDADLQLLA